MSELVGVAPAEPLEVARYRSVYCDAYAMDMNSVHNGLVMASFVGPVTALKSLWASLVQGQRVSLQTRDYFALWCQPDRQGTKENPIDVRYLRTIERLPDTEQAHLVFIIESATLQVRYGMTAYHLSAGPEPELDRFFALWNKAVQLPARPEWAGYLWERGRYLRGIVPCKAYGCHCWLISPELHHWAAIIRDGLRSGEID